MVSFVDGICENRSKISTNEKFQATEFFKISKNAAHCLLFCNKIAVNKLTAHLLTFVIILLPESYA